MVGDMNIWQFNAAVGGYAQANTPPDDTLSIDEAERLAAWLDAPPVWH